jgi:putative PIN family toxin of toxin-antitoxin system
VSSDILLDELRRAFNYPRVQKYLTWLPTEVDEFIANATQQALLVADSVPLQVVRDPDDNHLVEVAVAATADYLVTGDRDLLELSSYGSTQIVTPVRFVAILAASWF